MANDSIKKLAKKIVGVSDAVQNKKLKSYDTSGVVRRIEGNTAYIHFPGGIDETPVEKTINAYPGDTVQIRVSGGKAFLVGNATAPPTDDRVANVARRAATNAVDTATKAEEKAVEAEVYSESAMSSAESAVAYSTEAKQIAGKTNQYFWHKESVDPEVEDDETGAHITEVPQEEWEDPNSEHYHSGGNLLARSKGIAVRNGLNEIAYFSTTARIGTTSGNNVFVKDNGVYIRTGTNINAKFTNSEADIYSGDESQYYAKISPKSFGVYSKQYIFGYTNTIASPFQTGIIEENYTAWQELMVAGSSSGHDEHGDPTHVCSRGEAYTTTVSISGAIEPSSLLGLLYFQAPENFAIFPDPYGNFNFDLTYRFIYSSYSFDDPIVVRTEITMSTSSSPVNVFGLKLLYRQGRAYPYTAIGNYPDISKKYAFMIGNGSATKQSNSFTISQDGYIRSGIETIAPNITASKGTLIAAYARRFGQVVQLWIQYRNTSSTASGANIFEGTLNTTDIRPALSSSGVGYYGAHAMIGYITAAGAITIRNASSSAITIPSTSTSSVSITYLVN